MSDKKDRPLPIQAYEILKQKIIHLHYRPGEILMIQTLAKELGISRTPVREAVIRLEREGFVETAEGKKFKVAILTMKKVLEIHEIRKLMEEHAVRHVAEMATKKMTQELKATIKIMKKALSKKDHDAYFKADLMFHDKIIRYHGNETLGQLMDQVNDKMQRIRFLTTMIGDRLEKTIEEHQAVIDAIEEKNSEKAVNSMAQHLEKIKDGLATFFETQDSPLMSGMIIARNH